METSIRSSRSPTVVARSTTAAHVWHRLALVAILLLAVFLHFFRLGQEGYSNLYYAAAVKSMLTGWDDFFFASFDSAGFVTVDKPPLGLWVQTASAALFGFNGFSLLLPQALAGVLSVLLLYHLVKRTFGPTAGLIAALVLAVTPISVAANRNNTQDSLLVFLLLLAAWAVFRAAETGCLRWLLACAVLVGLGFNVKMLQAYLVLPAFYLLYLLGSPVRWWKRPIHLALATVVLCVVSFAWVVAVDLTPTEERPFVGSSSNNTVTELIVGHNGLSRLLPGGKNWLARLGVTDDEPAGSPQPPGAFPPPTNGQPGTPPDGGPSSGTRRAMPPNGQPGQAPTHPLHAPQSDAPRSPDGGPGDGMQRVMPLDGQPGQPPAQGGKGGGRSSETGESGLFRLFNRQLAGQISWLLPLAGLGFLAAAWQTRPRLPLSRRHQNLTLWAVWLLPMLVFFSVANLFHRYYLEMLAPAIAALVGAGVVAMWEDYKNDALRGWLLPLALLVGAAVEALILVEFPDWSLWLTPIVLGLCFLAGVMLAVARPVLCADRRVWMGAVAAAGVLALLIPLLVWASIPVLYGGHTGLPYAGPDLLAEQRRDWSAQDSLGVDRLAEYLQANRGDATYLAATMRATTASPLILATGEPVMAMGGFSGGDRILTVDDLREMVADGEVRFFLVESQGNRQGDLTRWVTQQCEAVPHGLWGAVPGGPTQLFDCGVD
jgi:4-amino-4-deoxy-L-arabinose transferase-like glycosyltransferase